MFGNGGVPAAVRRAFQRDLARRVLLRRGVRRRHGLRVARKRI